MSVDANCPIATRASLNLPYELRNSSIRKNLHRQLIESLDRQAMQTLSEPELRLLLRRNAEELCRRCPDLLNPIEREALVQELIDETLGLGPLEQLLRDNSIADIVINGPDHVFVERKGVLEETTVKFRDTAHLLAVLQRIVSKAGRRIDESSPIVDARLPDGSRVNAIIHPLALNGPLISIRRMGKTRIGVEQLLANEMFTVDELRYLASSVKCRASMIISGGTGSGKTTLLNALSTFIPPHERIITIEDTAELQLQRCHVASLEARPAGIEGTGSVGIRELIRNALRMRPDRIIVGECRGPEAFDMLQAMNTGHAGSLSTLHANSTRDAIARIEVLVGLNSMQLSSESITKQIASAIDILVHVERSPTGKRRVSQISEVVGYQNGEVVLKDVLVNPDSARSAPCALTHQGLVASVPGSCLPQGK